VTPADPDWTDVGDDGDGELAVAPTLAARRSRRRALQEARPVARQSELETSLRTRQDDVPSVTSITLDSGQP
jgi:hypothetical protein